MSKFWIILEPYTFIWSTPNRILLYNALSQQAFLADNSEILNPIVEALKDPRNLYSILVDEDTLQEASVKKFISTLRDNFMGDRVSVEVCKTKPAVIYPSLNVNEDMNRKFESIKSQETLGRQILNNLLSVDIYLGGSCRYSCDSCDKKYKQIRWCKSDPETLSYDKLQGLLSELSGLSAISVHFFGDILAYPCIDELLKTLAGCLFDKKIMLDYKYVLDHTHQMASLMDVGFTIGILIGETKQLDQLLTLPFLHDEKLECVFSVESESDFSSFAQYVAEHKLENVSAYPYFNGTNLDFFRQNIFQNEEDILAEKLNKREIFMRQTLNSNFFGKLIVLSNGNILSNINGEPIGTMDNGIKNAIYKEITEGSYWLQTRNKVEPCTHCLYKDLCSPPSNYEITIGRMNLCHVIGEKAMGGTPVE